MTTQNRLSQDQVEAFYHDHFVECQTRHFVDLLGADAGGTSVVVDIGGGRGFFAQRLSALTNRKVRVIDVDPVSIEACRAAGVEVEFGDALAPRIAGDEGVVTFNLILHHLVGPSEAATLELQSRALAAWRGRVPAVFVNEYIYESVGRGLAGRLIFQITKSKFLSAIAGAVSAFVPSLRANTFGVGVRFRAHDEWRQIFEGIGYEVAAIRLGDEEVISLPRRLLLIRRIRRDSFLLRPRS